MSTKHYFPEAAVNDLVPLALKALVAANPSLSLLKAERVVFNSNHKPSQVAIISGGGSGHEPAWSGYVGDGLLSAVACGDIFASPSMKQVLTAVASVLSEKGTILLITNYTGDKLHFGLAAERALAAGLSKKVALLACTDDVSIGRSSAKMVGRRGLAGNVLTMKILGAAAARDYSFERCVDIGRAIGSQLVSIGSALDHCHVPGRQNHESISNDVCVIGAGMHNEPGAQRLSPFPTVQNLIAQLLKMLCDPNDTDRAFVKFNPNDDVVLLINNYGGLSNLELGALTEEILSQLESTWHIAPIKIYSGHFETSLNGPGFSITLCNLSSASAVCNSSVSELMDLLGAETKAPSWPNVLSNTTTRVTRPSPPAVDIKNQIQVPEDENIIVDPKLLDNIIRRGCQRAIDAEPDLTKWDMVMGDGDCGEAVFGVCTAIIKKLDAGLAKSGSVFAVLQSIIDSVDDMGGTLGAIFGIFLAALATSLRSRGTMSNGNSKMSSVYPQALSFALERLKSYTGARVGDRTVMDVLIPFVETFQKSKDLEVAVNAAVEAAEGTRRLKPKFGRASYVGEGEGQEIPDPGAWALMEMVMGIREGLSSGKQ